jgi:hypothetical protein
LRVAREISIYISVILFDVELLDDVQRQTHNRCRTRLFPETECDSAKYGAESCRLLICDRDTIRSGPVRECLREAGIRIVQTPGLGLAVR